MAAPNLVNITTVTPSYATVIPAGTALTQLGTSPASANVFKINSLVVSNVTASAAVTTVSIYPNTTPTGTPSRLAFQISVPGNASLIVIDKSTTFYLPESYSIGVTSGTTAALEYSMGYEVLA